MDYNKIYNDLIEKARLEERQKGKIYYEGHHIIPRCLGGQGRSNQWKTHPNIVLLTAREHYIAHKLLCEIYPNNVKLKMAVYLFMNGFSKNNDNGVKFTDFSSREYERTKTELSNLRKTMGKYGIEGFTEKKYRDSNKDIIKQRIKKWRVENKEQIDSYKKQYREANKEQERQYYHSIKEKRKSYIESNKEKIDFYQKQYYKSNKEKIDSYQKQYRETNKERMKDYKREYQRTYREKNKLKKDKLTNTDNI